MTPGLLSVIVPNYNHAHLIPRQITAILGQSYGQFELIIVDDASTDDSVKVIESAIAGDSRAKLIRNETNRGVSTNWGIGMAAASGEFVCFPAADDLVFPGFFEKSVRALQEVPNAGVCVSNPAHFDDETRQVRPNAAFWSPHAAYFEPDMLVDSISDGEGLGGWSSIFRMQALKDAMPPHESFLKLEWHSDWFVLCVILARTGACYVPETLAALRIAAGTYSQSGAFNWDRQKKVIDEILWLLRSERYRDCISYFARGGFFCHVPLFPRYVMTQPHAWSPEVMLLAQQPIFNWNLEKKQVQQIRRQRAT
jgi:glycosyltransferase involved in cell wall biosynthesis